MDFNERRENTFDRSLANKPELDRPSSFFSRTPAGVPHFFE
jgi:hypothetical protein